MKNRIGLLSKIKGACSFFQKYINCPNITMFARKIFFLPSLGATALPAPLVSYAYG